MTMRKTTVYLVSAISPAGVERYRQGLRKLTLGDLDRVNRCLTDPTAAQPDQPEVADRQINAQYGWLRRLPSSATPTSVSRSPASSAAGSFTPA